MTINFFPMGCPVCETETEFSDEPFEVCDGNFVASRYKGTVAWQVKP